MSVGCQVWVWENSETNGNDRLVLLAIADEADDDGTNAFPSMDRLAAKCRVNRATVNRSIRRLEEAGELLVKRPEDYGRGRYNIYTVLMGRDPENVADCNPSAKTSKPTKRVERTARKGAEECAQVQPDPKTLRPKPESKALAPSAPSGEDLFERFWNAYPKARRLAKPDARAAWKIAVKRADPELIIAKAFAYTADPNRLDEFTPYPQKWLKQERWNAPPEVRRRGTGAQAKQGNTIEAAAAFLSEATGPKGIAQ